jgi:hypothetical protein
LAIEIDDETPALLAARGIWSEPEARPAGVASAPASEMTA